MTLYDSLASLGKIWTLIGAIFSTIVGVGMIIVGLYFLFRKPDRDLIRGTVARINDDEHGICTGQQFYQCSLSIQYVYNDQNYMSKIHYSGSSEYVIGQPIDIYVLKNNPYSIVLEPPLPKRLFYLFIAIGLVVILSGWWWYWASRKWKIVASAEGINGLFRVIGS